MRVCMRVYVFVCVPTHVHTFAHLPPPNYHHPLAEAEDAVDIAGATLAV